MPWFLPPMLCLDSVGHPVRSIFEWHAAHQTTVAVLPVSVGDERAKYRPAKELPVGSDLWGKRAFAQPAFVGPGKMGAIKAAVAGQR